MTEAKCCARSGEGLTALSVVDSTHDSPRLGSLTVTCRRRRRGSEGDSRFLLVGPISSHPLSLALSSAHPFSGFIPSPTVPILFPSSHDHSGCCSSSLDDSTRRPASSRFRRRPPTSLSTLLATSTHLLSALAARSTIILNLFALGSIIPSDTLSLLPSITPRGCHRDFWLAPIVG